MKIDIQTSGLPVHKRLVHHVEHRATFALSRLSLYVQQVKVSLSDQNGPRGGVDKRCQVQVLLADETPVIVTETSGDIFAAINSAFSSASYLAACRIKRRVGRAHLRLSLRHQLPVLS